jgi:hypothetical protein
LSGRSQSGRKAKASRKIDSTRNHADESSAIRNADSRREKVEPATAAEAILQERAGSPGPVFAIEAKRILEVLPHAPDLPRADFCFVCEAAIQGTSFAGAGGVDYSFARDVLTFRIFGIDNDAARKRAGDIAAGIIILLRGATGKASGSTGLAEAKRRLSEFVGGCPEARDSGARKEVAASAMLDPDWRPVREAVTENLLGTEEAGKPSVPSYKPRKSKKTALGGEWHRLDKPQRDAALAAELAAADTDSMDDWQPIGQWDPAVDWAANADWQPDEADEFSRRTRKRAYEAGRMPAKERDEPDSADVNHRPAAHPGKRQSG